MNYRQRARKQFDAARQRIRQFPTQLSHFLSKHTPMKLSTILTGRNILSFAIIATILGVHFGHGSAESPDELIKKAHRAQCKEIGTLFDSCYDENSADCTKLQ